MLHREEVAKLLERSGTRSRYVKAPLFLDNYDVWQVALYSKTLGNASTRLSLFTMGQKASNEGGQKLANMGFVWWWNFLLLPLPLLICFLLPPAQTSLLFYALPAPISGG